MPVLPGNRNDMESIVERRFASRSRQLLEMGLRFNGEAYVMDDINVYPVEIKVESDAGFAAIVRKIKAEIARRKKYDSSRTNPRFYDHAVDYDLLAALGVRVVRHQPWQLGLYHEELDGKIVWYPKSGTLMYQNDARNVSHKIGSSGDFVAGGHQSEREWVSPGVTEAVHRAILAKIDTQVARCPTYPDENAL